MTVHEIAGEIMKFVNAEWETQCRRREHISRYTGMFFPTVLAEMRMTPEECTSAVLMALWAARQDFFYYITLAGWYRALDRILAERHDEDATGYLPGGIHYATIRTRDYAVF